MDVLAGQLGVGGMIRDTWTWPMYTPIIRGTGDGGLVLILTDQRIEVEKQEDGDKIILTQDWEVR